MCQLFINRPLVLFTALLTIGNDASARDSLFIYEKGWLGGYGFLLVSESQKLSQFIDFNSDQIDSPSNYYQRQISSNSKSDSVLIKMNKSNFRKIKNQEELPNDSVLIADGHIVYIRFKSKQKYIEIAYGNPESHHRHEDSIVAEIWRSVWWIRDSCLVPISVKKGTGK